MDWCTGRPNWGSTWVEWVGTWMGRRWAVGAGHTKLGGAVADRRGPGGLGLERRRRVVGDVRSGAHGCWGCRDRLCRRVGLGGRVGVPLLVFFWLSLCERSDLGIRSLKKKIPR